MTRDDLIAVITHLGRVLDDNGGQRITEALARGVMLTLEQHLAGRVEVPPPAAVPELPEPPP